MFSFNSPEGACPDCAGLGDTRRISAERLIPDKSLSLREGAIVCNGFKSMGGDSWMGPLAAAALQEFGVTPDTAVYEIEITVTDNHRGDLIAAIKIDGQAVAGTTANKIVFANTYDAEATEIVISGTKVLNGRDLVEGEFTFELYENGNKIDSTVNKADGTFAFKAIEVDEEGRFVYTVKELKGDRQHVTYDETVYTVTATVTDNGDGTYTVEYAYAVGTETADGMVFTNVYEEPKPPIPSTGDRPDLTIWCAMLFISTATLGTTLYFRKRKES
jgi:pilin isopeptide linkage protein